MTITPRFIKTKPNNEFATTTCMGPLLPHVWPIPIIYLYLQNHQWSTSVGRNGKKRKFDQIPFAEVYFLNFIDCKTRDWSFLFPSQVPLENWKIRSDLGSLSFASAWTRSFSFQQKIMHGDEKSSNCWELLWNMHWTYAVSNKSSLAGHNM